MAEWTVMGMPEAKAKMLALYGENKQICILSRQGCCIEEGETVSVTQEIALRYRK